MNMHKTSLEKKSQPSSLGAGSGSIFLQIGMKVKIKNNKKDYLLNAGKEKLSLEIYPRLVK